MPLSPTPSTLDALLRRIDALVEQSTALPDDDVVWAERLHLDFELLLLFRRVAALLNPERRPRR